MTRLQAFAELLCAGVYAAGEFARRTSDRDLVAENEYLRNALKDERERSADLERQLRERRGR